MPNESKNNRPPSTEASRRAFVLRNYGALRAKIDALPDTLAGLWVTPPMGAPGRWNARWEYLESCDRDMRELVEKALSTPGGCGDVAQPPYACNVGLIDKVVAAEEELSSVCVRFIHTDAEVSDRPASRKYLFFMFSACEKAWSRAAGADETTDKKEDDR